MNNGDIIRVLRHSDTPLTTWQIACALSSNPTVKETRQIARFATAMNADGILTRADEFVVCDMGCRHRVTTWSIRGVSA